MDRRSFVQGLSGGAAGLAAWSQAFAAASSPMASSPAATPAGGLLTVASPAVGVWRRAFLAAQVDYEPVTVKVRGRLPDQLRGTLYRNGPALMRRGDTEYRHWFDGDGLVQSFTIGHGRLRHRARSVRTARFQAEQASGRYLWDGFGTSFPGSRPMSRPDDLNPANISMLESGGELLALWEAGSPYRIDPVSLETRGRKVYSAETDGLPFGAHPRVDVDGTIWNFGYLSGTGKMALYRIDATGRLRDSKVIEAPNADMVHDFAVTEHYLVFVLMPFLIDQRTDGRSTAAQGAPLSLLERYRWHNDRPTVILLVSKHTLAVERRFELPATGYFHLGNAWEEDGRLRVQVMRVGHFPGLIGAMYAAMQGRAITPFAHCDDGLADIVIDPKRGSARIDPLVPGIADFPSFDRRSTGRRTSALFAIRRSASFPGEAFGLNELVRVDTERQRLDSFDYGDSIAAEEHLYVPAPDAAPGAGWLLGTAYDWRRARTLFSVFDARSLSDGPLAQAELPRGMPPGLHGLFRATRS